MLMFEVRSSKFEDVIPAKAGIQTVFVGNAVADAKASWIPARTALGRNDGSAG